MFQSPVGGVPVLLLRLSGGDLEVRLSVLPQHLLLVRAELFFLKKIYCVGYESGWQKLSFLDITGTPMNA